MPASLEITTTTRVKAAGLLGIDVADTKYDTLLGQLVAEVSAQFESYIGHSFLLAERQETLDVRYLTNRVFTEHFPIASISDVQMRYGIQFAWGGTGARSVVATEYDFEADSGMISFAGSLFVGPRSLRITYTAGFAADTATFLTGYPEIASAADRQIAHYFQRRNQPEAGSVSISGSSAMRQTAADLLPSVVRTLDPWRRRVLI